MQSFTLTCIFSLACSIGFPQSTHNIDSLKRELAIDKADTSRVLILLELSSEYDLSNIDSSLTYGQRALSLAEHIQFSRGEGKALYRIGSLYRRLGEIPNGLELIYKGLQIAKDQQDLFEIANGYNNIGVIYFDLDEYHTAISYFQMGLEINKAIHNEERQVYLLTRISYAYSKSKELDSASVYAERAHSKWKSLK